MKYRISILIIGFIAISNVFADSGALSNSAVVDDSARYNFSRLTAGKIAKFLGWIRKDNCGGNLCCGHYFESSDVVNNPSPEAFYDIPVSIAASRPAFFTQQGTSIIQGDVVMSQPGREIKADKVTFFRDGKTGKIERGVFTGNVSFREYGKLLVAEKGRFDFVNKFYSVNRGIYRMLANTPTGLLNVWGGAKHAVSKVRGILKLDRATYTSCPPDEVTWYLWGNRLTLDRNAGRGSATNAAIFFKKVPVFYTPYFSFPIDKRRKSGFLAPTPTHSKDSGYGIDIPYYFNLAPNYDATFTPEYFTKRGFLFSGLFRYLTKTSEGRIGFNYIPCDRAFINFRDNASIKNISYERALKELKESSDSRGLIAFKNDSHFGEHWRGSLDVNYVTDDYFLQDFSGIATIVDNDQLLNRADVSYRDEYWHFLGRLQIFQTLHPVTHGNAKDQYKRLPQLNLSGDFPNIWQGLSSRLDAEIVNFMGRYDFYSQTSKPVVGGVRFNVMPSVSMPIRWLGGVITPRVQLQATGYSLNNQEKATVPDSVFRLVPLVSVDSSITLRRNVKFFNKEYSQTLEPRIFYLFVPTRDQDNIPLFDTYLPPFDINQLFRTNRFNGIDRVGDANQIAVAVTTRLLDDYGHERFNAKLGQIFVIHKHLVNIAGGNLDPLKDETLSPLVGQLRYFVNSKINATLNVAWDPSYQRLNTVGANLQYINNADRVINFWYHYVLNGDRDQMVQEKLVDLNRVGFSLGWKIWRHWNIIGSLNYNTSYSRAQNYLYGLEYNSCCWAIRLVRSKNFIGIGGDNEGHYDSRFYLQFLFKGMGNLDFGGLSNVLKSQIRGYRDKFLIGV